MKDSDRRTLVQPWLWVAEEDDLWAASRGSESVTQIYLARMFFPYAKSETAHVHAEREKSGYIMTGAHRKPTRKTDSWVRGTKVPR